MLTKNEHINLLILINISCFDLLDHPLIIFFIIFIIHFILIHSKIIYVIIQALNIFIHLIYLIKKIYEITLLYDLKNFMKLFFQRLIKIMIYQKMILKMKDFLILNYLFLLALIFLY